MIAWLRDLDQRRLILILTSGAAVLADMIVQKLWRVVVEGQIQ